MATGSNVPLPPAPVSASPATEEAKQEKKEEKKDKKEVKLVWSDNEVSPVSSPLNPPMYMSNSLNRKKSVQDYQGMPLHLLQRRMRRLWLRENLT